MNFLDHINSNMIILLAFFGLLVVLKAIFGKRKKKISGKFVPIPFLNSRAEQNFFTQLKNKLPDHIYVVPKVRLADLCKPENPKNIVAFNKVARKHIDFVLIEQSSSKIIAAIELDDKSHQKRDNIRRDKDKNYALSSAGIKLYRVKAARSYGKVIDSIFGELLAVSSAPKKVNKSDSSQIKYPSYCPRCESDKFHKIDMRWPNKGKFYFHCKACSYQSDSSA
ncbi:DUF2726 domain-containing protein [Vibrio marisflavi]|uniref:DUF2726 domain-containing protein n=1 Tax=Vibrio marisflavi CECT 7928 TaxID=634439 RepID=A0ABN8EF27_9VIBR|nr:DUF2726 domain-containing protein [Vibrio marisflavi]CAH0543216.1 hypothetical protein VMF7928_04475 [Vibrio marisflavi CECT 7928]